VKTGGGPYKDEKELKMGSDRDVALGQMKRMLVWICVVGVLMAIGALWYISLFGPLTIVVVTATIAGVFGSVVLGCGLFALGFYSDKSGYDEIVRDATHGPDGGGERPR
jgi:hypothetical protein